LGEGGMGAVWSVLDKRTGELGALKAIRPTLLTDAAIVRRFERELRTIAALNHPGIVQVLDVGRLKNGAPYMLMEQVDGVPLIDLDITGRSLGDLVRLFDRILAALAYAHARRIVHRDLKPDNVLVMTDPLGELHPKIMDFGLAMVAARGQMATRLTADGMVVGTPAYMAPEQACDEHHKIGPSTDLYAFGCMLYELLSGSPPHVATSPMALLLAHATKPPRAFTPLPSLPSGRRLEPLIMRLLAKDPLDRFELAADVRAELRASGLLDASETFDAEPLGPYGDTLLGMASVSSSDGATPPDPLPSLSVALPLQASALQVQRHAHVHIAAPAEAMLQVSVLNLREPELVGRSHEMNILHSYVEEIRQSGQASVARVCGPWGVGKSHLVRSLVEEGEARGALRYLRVNLGADSSVSLAVLQALSDHLRLRNLSRAHTEAALARFFQVSDRHDWRVLGFLELLVHDNKKQRSSTLGRLDLLLFEAIERLAKSRPLILWFDDTHQSTARHLAQFIQSLSARQSLRPCPALVITIDRTQSEAPSDLELELGKVEEAWQRPAIYLQPMSDAELLSLTTQGLSLHPHLAKHVVRLSNGIPQLAVTLAQHWHAAGLLERTPQGFSYRGDEAFLPVPESVQNIFGEQLHLAFGSSPKEAWLPVAQLAAVMGESFALDVLQHAASMLSDRARLISPDAFVERAVQLSILHAINQDEPLYSFASSLMREGLLKNIRPDRLSDLHRVAALSKQTLGDSHDPATRVAIARHFLSARAFNLAYESFLSAARELILQGRSEEAWHVTDAAHQALASDMGVAGPWDERVALVWDAEFEVLLLRDALAEAQERVQWTIMFSEQHVSPRQPLWTARAWRSQGRLLHRARQLAPAQPWFSQAILALRAIQDPSLQEDRDIHLALTILAFADCLIASQQHADADLLLDEAVLIARDLDDNRLLARTLSIQGRLALHHDDLDLAKEYLDEALTYAHLTSDLRTEAEISDSLASTYIAESNLADAERCLEHATHCYEALGDLDAVASSHQRLAQLAREQGREEDAAAHERWLKLFSR
jgi:eukaryotic-like serine/threonine-protein kinase